MSPRRGNPSCEGKVKFSTFTLAAQRARKETQPYHCKVCGSFHLGSQMNRRLGRRPRREAEA